jgi:ADP-ribose pyrophosphatase
LSDWQTLARRQVFSAPPWVSVVAEDVRLPSGRVVRDFYEVSLGDFALVVAQTVTREIVALQQYKHGVKRSSLMLPAGLLEAGEPPLTCARRELREETGYGADDWQPLGSFVMDGNHRCCVGHFFLARDARKVAEPTPDELEPLELRLTAPDAMLRATLTGEVASLAHAAAFMIALGGGFLLR